MSDYASILTMRHWLPILLFVLLPFQLSWATVGVYAQHESGLVGQQIGHYMHNHVDKVAVDEASTDVLNVSPNLLTKTATSSTLNSTSNTPPLVMFKTESIETLDTHLIAEPSLVIDDHFFDCDSTCIFMLNEVTWVSPLVIATPMVAKNLVNPASLLSLQPERPNWLVLA
jgi:hypothetical protein